MAVIPSLYDGTVYCHTRPSSSPVRQGRIENKVKYQLFLIVELRVFDWNYLREELWDFQNLKEERNSPPFLPGNSTALV